MNVRELYDHILKHLTPEEALMKLLEGSLLQYEKLKFDEQEKAVHPVIIISMATMDLGWNFMVESNQDNIRGLTIGTPEYLDEFKRMIKPS